MGVKLKLIVNYNTKTIQIKIVYYGAAMSGKTTSLKCLMSKFGCEQELQSIETSTGRTLVFDYGSLTILGKNWNLKILLLSATGQDFYASTRPATIEMADGIIFIVDSQLRYFEDNLRSWNELYIYFGERLFNLPIIVCLNKQDLQDIIGPELIKDEFKLYKFNKCDVLQTIATSGVGIITSFQKILQFLFPSITVSV